MTRYFHGYTYIYIDIKEDSLLEGILQVNNRFKVKVSVPLTPFLQYDIDILYLTEGRDIRYPIVTRNGPITGFKVNCGLKKIPNR